MKETTFNPVALGGIFLIVIGLLFVILYKKIAQWTWNLNYKLYQNIGWSLEASLKLSLATGLLIIVAGIDWLLDVYLKDSVVRIIEFSTILCLMGGLLFFYQKPLGESTSDFCYKFLHKSFHIRKCQIVYLILGLSSILFGILIASRIIW